MTYLFTDLPDSHQCLILSTILNEGGGVRNIDGTGNITYCGIREDRYRDYLDWAWLKAEEKRLGSFPPLSSSLRIFNQILGFYMDWFNVARDKLPRYVSAVDCLYFDMSVVAGHQQAARTLQRALNDALAYIEGYKPLRIDGRLGPLTRSALDGSYRHGFDQILLSYFAVEELAFFKTLAAEDTRHRKHLSGWYKRVERQIQCFRLDFEDLLKVLSDRLN